MEINKNDPNEKPTEKSNKADSFRFCSSKGVSHYLLPVEKTQRQVEGWEGFIAKKREMAVVAAVWKRIGTYGEAGVGYQEVGHPLLLF